MITIPLEVLNLHDDGFHLLVEVVVFGQSFKAVLDTGASKTVFDKTIMAQLTGDEELLVLTDKLSSGLGTNTMESYLISIPNFQIGKLTIPKFEAAVIDLSSINHAYQTMEILPVIGVIGGDLLMQYKAIINYKKYTLKLFA